MRCREERVEVVPALRLPTKPAKAEPVGLEVEDVGFLLSGKEKGGRSKSENGDVELELELELELEHEGDATSQPPELDSLWLVPLIGHVLASPSR